MKDCPRTIFIGITGMQGRIIGYLDLQEGKKDVFQKDLEAEFNIRRSTATEILQLMEKNGLIKREPVAHDARLKKLVLTEEARRNFRKIKGELDRIEDKVTFGLSEEELHTFFAVIDKIKENIGGQVSFKPEFGNRKNDN